MPAARDALMIVTAVQTDPGMAQLRSPASDADALGEALLAGFALRKLADGTPGEVLAEITAFLDDREPDDLLLLYVACHVLTTPGGLLLTTSATGRADPEAATVPVAAVGEALAGCAAGHVALVLDCCFISGPERAGVELSGLSAPVQVFLSATDRVEYVLDQGMIRGRGVHSKLTSALVETLRGGGLVTARFLADLPAAVAEIREPGLVIAQADRAAVPVPEPAPVAERPRRTVGDWAVRVIYWGLVITGLSVLAMLASGWFAWRIWSPGVPGDALDALVLVFILGLAVLGAGVLVAVAAFVSRRRRSGK
ncbi:caspase domain-containing protein [Nonomuraea sp. NPDC050790]|uniref:caspase domain-containing protein n=1 Tax=Nonomuraea sp. NPDC050790 TaxID=3364371 RepID=UPI0037B19C5D